jgi:hypothetical protein
MRAALALALAALAAGCTPYIPVRDEFGVSALAPAGDVPTEIAAFNAYNPGVGPLIAEQICATPYIKLEDKTLGATPGKLIQTRGRCQTHRPLLGDADPFNWTP